MSENIIFQNPPQTHARFGTGQTERIRQWLARVEAAGPDMGFAKFPERVNTSTASHIKAGKMSGVPKGKFDATTRNTKASEGKADLYVKFVGENPAAERQEVAAADPALVEAVVQRLRSA